MNNRYGFVVIIFCWLLLVGNIGNAAVLDVQTQYGDVSIIVEIARTEDERARGLMNRTYLNDESGMLFVFPYDQRPSFWMKNTLISLDMIFIDQNGRIVFIHENAKPKDLTPITPPVPARFVLEIGGGESQKLRISVDDHVSTDSLRKSLEVQ